MAKKEQVKTCFFIAPIGDEGSDIRKRSNQVLKHIVGPVADHSGYKAIRSDEISETGDITAQVIEHLIDDALVLADLTGWNPNVFYELAIRHAIRKPCILIIQQGQLIPFDISVERVIFFDYQDLDSAESCKNQIVKLIESIENDPTKVDSPVSRTVDLMSLRQSEDPEEQSNAEILTKLDQLSSEVASLRRSTNQRPVTIDLSGVGGTHAYPGLIDYLGSSSGRGTTSIGVPSGSQFIISGSSCPGCGTTVTSTQKICPNCGHDL